MNKSNDEIKNDFRALVQALKVACEMAKLTVPGATPALAIIAKKPDGSGQLTATFEVEQFLVDLEQLVGVKETK